MNPILRGIASMLLATSFWSWASAQQLEQNQLINIQFAGNGVGSKTGTAAVGAQSTDFWNLHSRDTQRLGTEGNRLLWADQSASPASIAVANAPGLWGNGHPDMMFGAYIYPFNTSEISVSITNLPSGTYRVLVYAHGGPPDEQNSKVFLQSGTNNFGWKRTTTTSAWRSQEWIEGNQFVQFTNVTVLENGSLSIQCQPDGASQAFLNGIQLVKERTRGNQELINVQFSQIPSVTRFGPAAIGNSTNDLWNKYIRDDPAGGYRVFGTMTNLWWSTGVNSGAGMTIANAPGAWGNGFPDYMFGAYLYPLGGGDIEVNFNAVPQGTYDVLVYAHGGPPDEQNAVVEVSSLGDSYGRRATSATSSWRSLVWQEGSQYVRFRNVTVTSSNALTVISRPGAGGVAVINGIQLLRTGTQIDLTPNLAILPDNDGIFTNSTTASIGGYSFGASARFTVDGTTPSLQSPVFQGELRFATNTTLRVQAFRDGIPVGPEVSRTFRRAYQFDDGITVQWRTRHFGSEYFLNPNAAAAADPDQDGSSNAQEFASDTDPNDPNSGFRIHLALVPRIAWRSTIGTTYQVLRKDSPSDRDWTVVRELTATNADSLFIDSEVPNPHGFYVVRPKP